MTVYFVGKILLIDLIEKFFEIEVPSIVTNNSFSRFGRGYSDFVLVRSNKIPKQVGYSLVSALNKTGQ